MYIYIYIVTIALTFAYYNVKE